MTNSSHTKAPNAMRAVRRIMKDVATRLPELSHIDSSRVLVLLGEARRSSRASVRPMHFSDTASRRSASGNLLRPRVRFKGRNIYYVLTLRPLFFLNGNPGTRIATIIHEMFHFSEAFDGTLHPARRHSVLGSSFQEQLSPLVKSYLEQAPDQLWDSMAIDGDVLVRMWLEKPGLARIKANKNGTTMVQGRRLYDERHTFVTTFPMATAEETRRRPIDWSAYGFPEQEEEAI